MLARGEGQELLQALPMPCFYVASPCLSVDMATLNSSQLLADTVVAKCFVTSSHVCAEGGGNSYKICWLK